MSHLVEMTSHYPMRQSVVRQWDNVCPVFLLLLFLQDYPVSESLTPLLLTREKTSAIFLEQKWGNVSWLHLHLLVHSSHYSHLLQACSKSPNLPWNKNLNSILVYSLFLQDGPSLVSALVIFLILILVTATENLQEIVPTGQSLNLKEPANQISKWKAQSYCQDFPLQNVNQQKVQN